MERADISLGGAEMCTFEIAEFLSKVGFEVDILAAKGQAGIQNLHILCQNSYGKRTNYFTFAKSLRKYISENHYDIVHSILPFGFVDVYQPHDGTYAESISRHIAAYQNSFMKSYKKLTAFTNFRRTVFIWAEKKLCKQTNGPTVIAISQYIAEQFKQHYGLSSGRIAVIPNGVKINERIDENKADKLRSKVFNRLRIREGENPVFFLFAGNNFRRKGLAVLIKAMQLAIGFQSSRQAYLIVAGQDRAYKYRRLAKKLNVHKKVIFLGSVRQIQDVLLISDVAVLPTFYDPCSRYILEALATNKPVITTRFNGATDLFVNNRHGKVIDRPENIVALAEAINYFTNSDNIRKASEAIVVDNLKEKISLNRAIQQVVLLYESIMRKKGMK